MLHETPEFRHFRNAFAEGKAPLTIIVGAGLSTPAGLPTWSALEKKLRQDVEQKRRSLGTLELELRKKQYASLKEASDPWIAFQSIKNILGPATFESSVQEFLTPNDDSEIPVGYGELLKLKPNSLVSLNLDRFAGEAAVKSKQKFLNPIYGKELASKWGSVVHTRPSIIYLHGDVINPSTWVMTRSDLDGLLSSDGHRAFLEHTYLSNIVLFVGLSAEDAALSVPLIRLTKAKFAPPQLYWLTHRASDDLQRWADDHRVRVIRYTANGNDDHARAISEFVSKVNHYIPKEPEAPPVISENIPPIQYSDPADLSKLPPEEIRRHIASDINRIILESNEDSIYENYRKYCIENDFAIHTAFYRPNRSGSDTWFGYELSIPSIGRGNFGEVYSATDSEGNLVAVKIMNKEAFSSDEMLGGFRRGVRSMNHVSEGGVEGMTTLIDAFEMPPTIVMPFISGMSLQQILDNDYKVSWSTVLRIASSVGKIVAKAHALPATVMHRDLKPSNIMIKDYDYSENFDPDVVVLDFDMSWHKGSKEKDVIFESRDDFGYLAPEQTVSGEKYHPRNTKVDSYGLGMTMYALFSHKAPLANEPLNPSWYDKILVAVSRNYDRDWRSAPFRLARLIRDATEVDQSARKDYFRLSSQIDIVLSAVEDESQLEDADVWAEEVLARIGASVPYSWDDDRAHGRLPLPSVTVSAEGASLNREVTIKIEHADVGMQKRGNLKMFLKENLSKCDRFLKDGGWKVEIANVMMSSLVISAKIPIESLRGNASPFDAVREAVRVFK